MDETISIRQALLTDVEDVINIEKKCFSSPWEDSIIFQELLRSDTGYYLAFYNEKAVGVGGYQIIVGQGHITTLAVLEEYRNKHIASKLLEALLEETFKKKVYDMTLEVRVSNEGALNLYKKHGFKVYGTRKGYYLDNNEDAHIMWRFADREQTF